MRKLVAEFIGTFVLVFGGCGSAVFSAAFPQVGIGLLGVSLAFGLTVLGCAYGLGHVSGCHLNPAVSIGLCAARRFSWRELPGYIGAQILGGTAGAAALYGILKSAEKPIGNLAANGFAAQSPGKFGMGAGFAAEVILTFIFLTVILGATSKKAVVGFAGIPIGLTLTLVHLVGIPITNLSVNPARSTGPAIMVGGAALEQLWLFWVAPIVGALLAGFIGEWLHRDDDAGATAKLSTKS